MQFLLSTPIVLLLCLLFVLRGPDRGLFVFFAFLPMGMMGLVNLPAIGSLSILAIDFAVVLVCLMLVARPRSGETLLRVYGPGSPGAIFLLIFLYALLSSLFLPRVFSGMTEVFGIARIEGVRGIVSRPLAPTNGNLSQVFRLLLSTLAFGAMAFIVLRRPDPSKILAMIKVATVVHVGMGLIDITLQALNASFLLDWARTANYSLTLGQRLAGLNRMIGGFPEASSYGYMSLGLMGFWLCYWFQSRNRDRTTPLFFLTTLFVVLRSTSSSAYVGLGILAAVFLLYKFVSLRDTSVTTRGALVILTLLAALPLVAMALIALYQIMPGFADFIDRSLIDKLGSSSGLERMSWNRQALQNFVDTWGLGAGLGSVRASNWAISVLASMGLLGALLFAWALIALFSMRLTGLSDEAQTLGLALKFCCFGFLARALVVKANVDLGIAFCAIAGLLTGLGLYATQMRRAVRYPAQPIASTLARA
ncbi:MAG: hypothetical protein AAF748_01760 [Pseudomonadota bacterium]